jgi:small-conductance mechanosensitive channel
MTLQPVVNALLKILSDILNFLPRLVNGVLLLLIGYLLSILVRRIVRFIFRRMQLDQLFERVGITHTIQGFGVRLPISDILAQIIFFFILLSFATSAASLMGFTTAVNLLQSLFSFIPRAISATIIVIVGSMIAHFLGAAIESISRSVRISYGRALGRVIEYIIVAFVVILALSTLGVDTTILTTGLALVVASAGLALALTFAFGSRESAHHVIAGFYVRQRFPVGQRLTFEEYSGTVRSTTGAYTVLDISTEAGTQQTLSLPNALLLQRAIPGQDESPNRTASAGSGNPPDGNAPSSQGSPAPENAPSSQENSVTENIPLAQDDVEGKS